jgi:hypothetical protein
MKNVAVVLLNMLIAMSAAAQQRTFVSAKSGNDANPCTLASPCRNLQRGVDAAASGGEVIPLDSGGYGPFYVGKPLNIATPAGVYASVTTTGASGVYAISIGAGAVTVRGLAVSNVGGFGEIHYDPVTAGVARIDSCTVDGSAGNGITSFGALIVTNSTISRSALAGIFAGSNNAMNAAIVMADQVCVTTSGRVGIYAGGSSNVAVRNAVVFNNVYGLIANSSGIGTAKLTIEGSIIEANTYGVATGPNPSDATIHVSSSAIVHNTSKGIWIFQNTIFSRGNNTVIGNASDEVFSGMFAAQ